MTINAKEKIINIINELLPMDNNIQCDHYRNEKAVELFYKLPYYFNIKELLKEYNHQYLQYSIDSYIYPNGLIRLESYCVFNGEYVINQTIVTDNLEGNSAIIDIYNRYELKTAQQFFIKSSAPNSLFGTPSNNKDRSIEINETEIAINDMCIGRFQKIGKKNSSVVYSEKYIPINRILVNEFMPENAIELEILYCYDDIPVYAQLLYDESNPLVDKTSSNHIIPEFFVNNVNCEVNAITEKIATIINGYNKNNNFVKSLWKN